MSDDKPKSMQHSLAASTRWLSVDPDARVAHMTALSQKAKAAREKKKAEREARGEVVKPARRTRHDDAMPPIADLLPIMQDVQDDRKAAGLPELSADRLMREASLRIRRAIAESTYRAMKGDQP